MGERWAAQLGLLRGVAAFCIALSGVAPVVLAFLLILTYARPQAQAVLLLDALLPGQLAALQ